ncbi:hypothetical protein ABFX02_14G163000 [Erythranthe guttata]
MEYKHFSHSHGLVFHQAAPGSEIHCSGCKSPGSGNVYACWRCNYFLHEQCFRASRSFNHPSHPQHPLTLVSYPTHTSAAFFCNSCNHGGSGFCYCCSECDFDVHIHCAHMTCAPNAARATSVPLDPNLSNPNPYPNPNPAHNFQSHNQIYPPPVAHNPFPNYVPY